MLPALAVALTVPALFVAILMILSWLEEHALAPEERAVRLAGLLDQADPDEIEVRVAEILGLPLSRYASIRKVPTQPVTDR